MRNLKRNLQKQIIPGVAALLLLLGSGISYTSFSQEARELTVAEIMNAIIAPMTSTIWGAYDVQTEAQWQSLENAAVTVIAAGDLLKSTGALANNSDWQDYNTAMIRAARMTLTAIENKDEEALFNAGNDQLYPPCESCHQKYMGQ